MGVSVVNALSDKLQLTIRRQGHVYEQFYHLGEPQGPLTIIGETQTTVFNRCVSGQVQKSLQLNFRLQNFSKAHVSFHS